MMSIAQPAVTVISEVTKNPTTLASGFALHPLVFTSVFSNPQPEFRYVLCSFPGFPLLVFLISKVVFALAVLCLYRIKTGCASCRKLCDESPFAGTPSGQVRTMFDVGAPLILMRTVSCSQSRSHFLELRVLRLGGSGVPGRSLGAAEGPDCHPGLGIATAARDVCGIRRPKVQGECMLRGCHFS